MTQQVALYPYRNVWYLAGALDQCSPAMPWYNETGIVNEANNDGIEYTDACNYHHVDTRCPAMLQGPWREYRTSHYMAYLTKFYGREVHTLTTMVIEQDLNVVPTAGHDGSAIYNAVEGKAAVFTPVFQRQVYAQDPSQDEDQD